MDGQTVFVGAMLLTLVFFMAMMWFKPEQLKGLMEADREHKKELGKMVGGAVKGGIGLWRLFRRR